MASGTCTRGGSDGLESRRLTRNMIGRRRRLASGVCSTGSGTGRLGWSCGCPACLACQPTTCQSIGASCLSRPARCQQRAGESTSKPQYGYAVCISSIPSSVVCVAICSMDSANPPAHQPASLPANKPTSPRRSSIPYYLRSTLTYPSRVIKPRPKEGAHAMQCAHAAG